MIDEYKPMINEAKQKMGEKYTQAIDYAIGMTETTTTKLSVCSQDTFIILFDIKLFM